MTDMTVLEGTINWARLNTPGESYDGDPQWELTLVVTKDVADGWTTSGYQKTTKQDKEGNFIIKLKKPKMTAAGKEQKPPKVRHVEGYVLDGDTVGNGSKGRVQVALIPYNYKGKDGITPRLNALIINDLVEFNGTDGTDEFFQDLPSAPDASFDEDGGDY